MATDKTPDHKRIKRAEEGREEWKVKALARRAEVAKLKSELNNRNEHSDKLLNQNNELKQELKEADKKITKLEKEIENLKKKHSARG